MWRDWKTADKSQLLIVGGAIVLVVYLTLLPVGLLVFGSFRSGPPGTEASFTLDNYIEAYTDRSLYVLLKNSFLYAIGSSALSLFLGTGLAWVCARTDAPLRRLIGLGSLVPIIVPSVLMPITWVLLLSPTIGIINKMGMSALGAQEPIFSIYSFGGMIWADATHNFPLVFLLMSAAFSSMDFSLEEASLAAGAGQFTTFLRITIRVMTPALVSVTAILLVRGLESFEVPAVIGLPAHIEVFTTKMWESLQEFPPKYNLAGALASLLFVFTALGTYFFRKVSAEEKKYATISGKGYRSRTIELGIWGYLVTGVALAFLFVAVILPLLVMVWASLLPYYMVPSRAAMEKLTFGAYYAVLDFSHIRGAFSNSFILATTTATAVMLLTSVIAWITVKTKMPGRGVLDALTFFPIAMPGIVLGTSLIWVYLSFPLHIYGTLLILVIGYLTKYLPYGMRVSSATAIQIHQELEEAALVSGSGWGTAFRRILLPLLMPGFSAGWLFIFIHALKEFSTSILLYTRGTEVLSIVIFDLWQGGQFSHVAALGVIMIAVLGIFTLVASRLSRRVGIYREARFG